MRFGPHGASNQDEKRHLQWVCVGVGRELRKCKMRICYFLLVRPYNVSKTNDASISIVVGALHESFSFSVGIVCGGGAPKLYIILIITVSVVGFVRLVDGVSYLGSILIYNLVSMVTLLPLAKCLFAELVFKPS